MGERATLQGTRDRQALSQACAYCNGVPAPPGKSPRALVLRPGLGSRSHTGPSMLPAPHLQNGEDGVT